MPEAPDLHVIKEFLQGTLPDVGIVNASVLRPIVLRSLAVPSSDFSFDISNRVFQGVWRRGKFLGLNLSSLDSEQEHGFDRTRESLARHEGGDERLLIVNPMLSGGLHYCAQGERVTRKTFLTLTLNNGQELRYFDYDQMGMVYYVRPDQIPLVPRLNQQGPDVLDAPLDLEEFKSRLRPHRGEVKGVLTRGVFVSGIGNAYADEVLFAAGLFPFRKVTSLKGPELERLHTATYDVVNDAVSVLKDRVGSNIHIKVRDFLRVHGHGGNACPQCGSAITSITANGRLTNYCRHCQPGSLISGGTPLRNAPH